VRELENAVFRACASARGPEVAVSDLELRDEGAAAVPSSQPEPLPPGVLSLQQAEAVAIRRALEQTSGNKSHASRLLGISRKQLYVKLRQYGLSTC
jgi:DNA-binding NtrC family response regulator